MRSVVITIIIALGGVLCLSTVPLFAEEGTLIFSEGFTNGISTEVWEMDSPNSWTVENGVLHTAQYGGFAEIREDLGEDIVVNAWLKPIQANPDLSDGHCGVRVGGVLFLIRKEGFWCSYISPGATSASGELKRADIVDGKWYQYRIVRRSSGLFQWYVNGEKIYEFVEPGMQGGVSLNAWRYQIAYDNINVWQLTDSSDESVNLIRNGSFENWQDNLAPYWRPGIGVSPGGSLDEFSRKWRMDDQDKFEGLASLRLEADSEDGNGISSFGSSVKSGEPYTYSVYMKSDRELSVRISVAYLGIRTYIETVNTTTNWQRYSVSAEGTNINAKCVVSFDEPGVLWVDAAQLEQGTNASPFCLNPLDFGNEGETTNETNLSEIMIPRFTVPPVLDGKLDDSAWQQATQSMSFLIFSEPGDGEEPGEPTEAYLGFDDENLYIGFRCYDSQMGDLAATMTNRDGRIWNDDCIEVYLDTRCNRESYYRLVVNPLGTQLDAENTDLGWSRDWTSKTFIYEDRWTVELALPLSSLDVSSLTGTNWGLNLCRQNHKAGEYSCTSPVRYMNFADVSRYGVIQWDDSQLFTRYHYAFEDLVFLSGPDESQLKGTIRNSTQEDITLNIRAELSGIVRSSDDFFLASGDTAVFTVSGFPPQESANVVKVEALESSTQNLLKGIHELVEMVPLIFLMPELSYYTDEEEARIYGRFGFGEETLTNSEAILELRIDEVVWGAWTNDTHSAEIVFTVPIIGLPTGEHELTLQLRDNTHQEIASTQAMLRKLDVRENEVKIDLVRRVLVVDGEPFMVFAPLVTFETDHTSIDQRMAYWASHEFSTVACWLKTWESWSKDYVDQVMNAALSNGLKVIFWLANPPACTDENFEYAINEWKDAPALLAWGVYDEPLSVSETVTNRVEMAKAIDPYHPVYINFTSGGPSSGFGSMTGDVMSIDYYFVPRGTDSLKLIPDMVGEIDEVAEEKQVPTWIWLECENLQNHYREPTAAEQEAQTYGSMIAGATGLKYFYGQPLGLRHWEKFNSLRSEMLQLSPVIFSPDPVNVTPVSSPSILTMTRKYNDAWYVIAANVDNKPISAAFDLTELAEHQLPGANVLFEDRSVYISDGLLRDDFAPYQRHVYQVQAFVKSNQTIQCFIPTNGAVFTMTDLVELQATASSGLAVTNFAVVSGPGIISGVSNLTFTSVGTVFVTALQCGNTNWNGTPPVTNVYTVTRAAQTIAFVELPEFTYGDSEFSLTATASSELPVSYESDNLAVATILGSNVTIVAAGTGTITAIQSGNVNYLPASNVSRELIVSRKTLLVRANDKGKSVGCENPRFDAEYTGLVEGDAPGSIGLVVEFSCSADTNSPVGTYDIVPSGTATTVNYTVSYQNGTLTVTQAPTVILSAEAVPNPVTNTMTELRVIGDDDGGEENLAYTWSTEGIAPAAVTFSLNGGNAAKTTTANFTKAGEYFLQVAIMDVATVSVTSHVSVTVSQTISMIEIDPSQTVVVVDGIRPFIASAKDQFGDVLSAQPSFDWSVDDGGSIDPTTGVFSATSAGGPYTVTALAGGLTGTATVNVIHLLNTLVHYVASGGGSLWPYISWSDAATNVQDAVDVASAGDVVLVTNGTYVLTNMLTIADSITLRSFNNGATDRDGTVINGNYPTVTNRCVYLNDIAAVLDGLTLTNGFGATNSFSGHGGGLYLAGGTVTNCLITSNETPGAGGGVYLDQVGTIVDSTISGNIATNNNASYGGGIYFYKAGMVTNCLVSGNRANWGGGLFFNGLGGAGGLLIDSTVANNEAFVYQSGQGQAGIGMYFKGLVTRCNIVSNTITVFSGSGHNAGVGVSYHAVVRDSYIAYNSGATYGGGIRCGGGGSGSVLVTNCVVMHNSASVGGGVYMGSYGLMVDCTVVSNSHAAFVQGDSIVRNSLFADNNSGIAVQSGTTPSLWENCTIVGHPAVGISFGVPAVMDNCVVYDNNSGGANWSVGSGIVPTWTNSCTVPMPSGLNDAGNITNNPVFAAAAAGNYRLRYSSPCVNTGINRAWMIGAVDLDGEPRLVGTVDMGAYELPPPLGTCIIVQ